MELKRLKRYDKRALAKGFTGEGFAGPFEQRFYADREFREGVLRGGHDHEFRGICQTRLINEKGKSFGKSALRAKARAAREAMGQGKGTSSYSGWSSGSWSGGSWTGRGWMSGAGAFAAAATFPTGSQGQHLVTVSQQLVPVANNEESSYFFFVAIFILNFICIASAWYFLLHRQAAVPEPVPTAAVSFAAVATQTNVVHSQNNDVFITQSGRCWHLERCNIVTNPNRRNGPIIRKRPCQYCTPFTVVLNDGGL
jgi:hypothetical protein